MNKQQFLEKLKTALGNLCEEDINRSLDYYSEMIDDRVEDGVSEEDAVAEIGDVDQIASQIISETPLSKLIKEKKFPKRKISVLEIVLLILGAPIWIPLLVAAVVVFLAVYVVIWSLVISVWAAEIAIIATAFSGIIAPIVFLCRGYVLSGLALLGAGLFCIGLSIFTLFGCKATTKCVVVLTKKIILWIKLWFVKKEGAK